MPLFSRNALIALAITIAIIATVLFAINYLNQQRVDELRTIEDELATDTLSIETQFDLLEEAPCEDVSAGTTLSQEVGDIGDRLAFAEEHSGKDDPAVLSLKERYTLLEIRDYLLSKRLAETCGLKPTVALYFYSNIPGECTDCDRAGFALSYLRQTYPSLRVYSFDYHLDLAASKTLASVVKVDGHQFPAFVINGKTSYGFTTLEDFQSRFPKALFATTTASTTKAGR